MLYASQDYLGGTDKVQSIIRQFLGETKVSIFASNFPSPDRLQALEAHASIPSKLYRREHAGQRDQSVD